MSTRQVVYLIAGRRNKVPHHWGWKLQAHRTSFYVTSGHKSQLPIKLSIHDHDERHPSGAHNRVELTGEAIPIGRRTGDWPLRPSGQQVAPGVTWIMRIRWTWDAYLLGPVGNSPRPGKSATAWCAHPPDTPGSVTDVDFFLSRGRPAWPGLPFYREFNGPATLPPMRTESDLYLSGLVQLRREMSHPTPVEDTSVLPSSRKDAVRGQGAIVGDDSVLWLVELPLSRHVQP